jgi:hypothetical protein
MTATTARSSSITQHALYRIGPQAERDLGFLVALLRDKHGLGIRVAQTHASYSSRIEE